ncbi:LysR family transcriptional regulator [Pseudomonas luteola]|uniref:LysR family transcriptional regulator n=1 Tax=Pseudomonas luteola TaxID=47886 RepID=UPI000F7A68F0|nr:LysR family transcriptional regulator [Pseudomonas luteola]RRW46718.1 LysR family transcriptional regulator [Pseudomonas luteola]
MEFKQLRMFIEVVRQGGFTASTRVLHATQSTVSKQIAHLEQSLGLRLLDRTGPVLQLTDAGHVVLKHAEHILRQHREMLTELDDLARLVQGQLRVGLPILGAETLFAAPFSLYRKRYPQITVHLVEGGSKLMEELVIKGDIEIGGCLTPNDPSFDYQPFCNEPLDAVLSCIHPLANRPRLALAELAATPFLLYQQSYTLNDRLLQACREAGFTPQEGGRSGQADFLIALAAAGQGVVLLPRIVAQKLIRPDVVRIPLTQPDLRWDASFIWRRGAYLSRAARTWLDLMREVSLEQFGKLDT